MSAESSNVSQPEASTVSQTASTDSSSSLRKFSWSYWLIFATITATLAFYFARRASQARAAATYPVKLLDALIGFTPSQAYEILRALGPEGRKIYREINLVDFVLAPLVFRELAVNTFPATSERSDGFREIFANTYMLADVLENVCVSTMLKFYPREIKGAAWIGCVGNVGKYIGIGLAAISILYEMFLWINRKLSNLKTKKIE